MAGQASASERRPAVRALLAYGGFGLPLSFLALPLYITLPEFYARQHGMALMLIGTLLLISRLVDACADPLIGRWVDNARRKGSHAAAIIVSIPLMAGGFAALFLAPPMTETIAAFWLLASLLVTFAGFSLASIAYQAWGAELAKKEGERARITGIREGFGLAGMVVGALLPQMVGATATTIVLALCLMAFGGLLVLFSPRPQTAQQNGHGIHISWFYPFHQSGYGWLFLVFLANGIASAIPATLMPFFVRDALNIADWMGPLLALYLLAGAAAIPLWVRLSKRIGLVRTWLWGMGLSVVTFAWAFLLPGYPGDLALVGFAMVAGLSGIALGADLVAPAALLAGIIHKAGDAAERGGSYFGLWNFGAKLTLALAAGMALPLLDWLGYVPGTGLSQPDGITALAATYCLLPCFLKICAATLLWRARHHLAGD